MSISKELRVGIVVIISLGLFYYGFNYLKGSNIFKTGSFYYAEYPNVNGLSVDDPVFTKGFRVGKVSSTKLNMETGKILVQLQITNEEIKIPLILSIETLLVSEIIFETFNLPKSKLASEMVGTTPPFP